MYFSFKENPEDFIVREILPYELAWVGDFFYVYFEKSGINTMEVVMELCRELWLLRKELGIAGLKDKDGITAQWISIWKKSLNNCWWKDVFLKTLWGFVKILDTNRHTEPLAIGKNRGNFFKITLGYQQIPPEEVKLKIEDHLAASKSEPIPNVFWIQRFGRGNKNYKKAARIFSWDKDSGDNYELKFKLQAFWSMWFNEYVMKRWKDKAFLLEWDIMVDGWNAFGSNVAQYIDNKLHHFDYRKAKEYHEKQDFWSIENWQWESDFNPDIWLPTWPVLWTEQLLCKAWTEARKYDDWVIQESKFGWLGSSISSRHNLYGFRRPLWITVPDIHRYWGENWLILEFSLPTGSYASSYLASILWDVDPEGCEVNWLIIPRVDYLS